MQIELTCGYWVEGKNSFKDVREVSCGYFVWSGQSYKLVWFITGLVVNSKRRNKIFSLMPGEVLLASLDDFGKFELYFL